MARRKKNPVGRPRVRRREASIEAACLRHLKRVGLLSRKMNGFGFNAWPDRQVFPPDMGAPWTRPMPTLWVELKRPGEAASPAQAELHDMLRRRGQARVEVVDSVEGFKAAVAAYLRECGL